MRLSSALLLRAVLILILAACCACDLQNPWGETIADLDLSDDLHHRMQAGLVVPSKEPIAFILMGGDPKGIMGPVAHKYMKISWDMGNFWVRSDKLGRINVYMNNDAAFGHVHIAASRAQALMVNRDFIESPVHPIWPDLSFKLD